MNASIIKSVRSKKCLVVHLDNRLAFDIYIANFCKRIF